MKRFFLFAMLYMAYQTSLAQCSSGTLLSIPDQNAAYTFAANTVTYLPSGTVNTNGNLTFGDGGTLCIGPGASLNLNSNNFTLAAGSHFTINVYGTLYFGTNPQINGNWDINIYSSGTFNAEGKNFIFSGSNINIVNAGVFKIGKLEMTGATAIGSINNTGSMTINDDFNFAGKTFTLNNNSTSTFSLKTLAISNSAAIVTIENNTAMNVSSTLNLNLGTANFRNLGTLTVGQNYNSSPTSTYINCGTYTGAFNLNNGGKLINSGTFTSGQIEFGGSISRVENYGRFTMTSGINLSGSIFYNEGIMKFTSGFFQGTGTLQGPSDNLKKGYFSWSGQCSLNSPHIGPNLYFSGTAAGMFNGSQIITSPVDFSKLETDVTLSSNIACPNADGTPSIPIPLSTSVCKGSDLTTMQATESGVTYEWWTGSINTRTAQVTTSSIPSVGNYTTAGTVYLWSKNVANIYSQTGSAVTVVADPQIDVQPTLTTTTTVGGSISALSVTASGGTPSLIYQWYSNSTNSTIGSTKILTATSSTYAPPTAIAGTTYYYCIVSATGSGCGSALSAFAAVTVNPLTVDYKITKTVNNISPKVGDQIVFTIVAENIGTADATNVVVDDVLAAGYEYVSCSPVGAYSNATHKWNIGSLAQNTSATLTITVKVK